jgi:putative membrane protein
MLRWLLASVHLLAFGIGLGSIEVRARALSRLPDPPSLRRALSSDAWWGIAALLWVGTGLPRLFLGTEKPTAYYTANHLFWLKMGLFTVIFLLELRPMVTLTRWRRALARGEAPDTALAPRLARSSRIQIALVLGMLFVATAMARGYGAGGP